MKKTDRLKISIVLFSIGFVGILSLLTNDYPDSMFPKRLLERFSIQQIKLLILINPIFLLITTILIGIFIFDKINLQMPLIQGILKRDYDKRRFIDLVRTGMFFGFISSTSILIINGVYNMFIKNEINMLNSKFEPSIINKILYGGFTEEIMLRFGLMSFITWLIFKIFKQKTASIFWVGIMISALLFAMGHLPTVYSIIKHPSILMLSYIIVGNSLAGVIFGWLYWKKGLETAFVAHMVFHIMIILWDFIDQL